MEIMSKFMRNINKRQAIVFPRRFSRICPEEFVTNPQVWGRLVVLFNMIDGEESDESEEMPQEDRDETKIDKELLNVAHKRYEHEVQTKDM